MILLVLYKSVQLKLFIINKQVESLFLTNVKKYDEELFTNLFDVTNKIEIKKFRIRLYSLLSNKQKKNICAKIHKKIRSLETQNIISSEVSCFIKSFY